MKTWIFIVLLAISYCHAHPKSEISKDDNMETFLDKKLRNYLENFRIKMREGVSFMDNMTLDPLSIKTKEFNENFGFIVLNATINNFLLEKLSEYNVTSAKLSLPFLSAALNWTEINLNTDYKLNAVIADQYPIFGNEYLSLNVVNFSFYLKVKLIFGDPMSLKIEKTVINVEKFQLKITGLFNDEEVSELLSMVISLSVPEILESNQEEVTSFLNPLLETYLNEIIKYINIDDILGMNK